MQQWMPLLAEHDIGKVLEHEPLSKYTTWKIGGPADALVIPDTKEQLARVLKLASEHGIPWMQLGRGSNMLVSDKGIRGLVIKLGPGFDYVHFENEQIVAGGGVSLVKLCVMASKQGLSGLEFAGGIPGSVGGAVYMNAGAHGSDVSQIFQSAEIVLDTGELAVYDADNMHFSYRHSVLHEQRGMVTEAVFRMKRGDREEISSALAAFKDRRRLTQPLQLACAGSVFRNPPGDYAARLIESAGLKGLKAGGAEVSVQHANFIVNTGQATAEDVLTLMKHIQSTISSQTGIKLVPEVFVVGER
ncbi:MULTISPECIES: UDP-N-acetylmuramate dehydrogenase [Paenibacillus]|uniref:UDP-N-acetylmuramate dehydrogenase n=1 Tax=Paenibacillus TaxID=44249 RepID=UPI0008461A3F|nr:MULTISPECIES: UDP-N-acetylmuramate dehydrogenase [Paenibacillus]AOK89028.1 UDP-N-acetylenolpyruvoylglucosamine reductase [Paenibacillus polymyxa]KAE8560006.1 UDP-N-acetylenolpyruvoylglucosamine reductase [Paenibacillus polymyxa]KAF6578159.1 UDP-N-acetylmuramate dehydrogenase [Paenibacillus sp. EKM212P]MCJ1221837.1 UDP-N-acetylmuramate dehydrogenase [Paenibacillus polymyxa]MCP3781341.1 UDP-N-acetylmuramate dehydrogenase [Paenibacillus sp. MZ03-122A]